MDSGSYEGFGEWQSQFVMNRGMLIRVIHFLSLKLKSAHTFLSAAGREAGASNNQQETR